MRSVNIRIIKNALKKQRKNILYKNTATKFKKKFGISLDEAPLNFVKDGMFYTLSHHQFKQKGHRVTEVADYIPLVDVGNCYSSLTRNDIKV